MLVDPAPAISAFSGSSPLFVLFTSVVPAFLPLPRHLGPFHERQGRLAVKGGIKRCESSTWSPTPLRLESHECSVLLSRPTRFQKQPPHSAEPSCDASAPVSRHHGQLLVTVAAFAKLSCGDSAPVLNTSQAAGRNDFYRN